MKVLITNDDGIYSRGIYALYEVFSKIADVTVVAPITEQSAVGHAITISLPLRIHEVYRKDNFFGYGVNGTPADCVKLAFSDILTTKPDLVISGVNRGANLASNVIYSGTVSAATEGAMMGVPSIAVSLASVEYHDYSVAAEFAIFFAKKVLGFKFKNGTLWNINVPPLKKSEIKGWRYAVQGKTKYLDTFEKRLDPRGNTYYWLTGEKIIERTSEESDDYLLERGFITVTPIKYDLTDCELYKKLKEGEENYEFN
jgi:5'-nucleotidase